MAESIQSITILGTGLIGSSVGLALRANGFAGSIIGWDRSPEEAEIARDKGAIDSVASDPLAAARERDCVLLATPVFGILEWIEKLAPVLRHDQLVTDVGSTKRKICALAAEAFSSPGAAYFLPGHPMAGKEVFGAANADAESISRRSLAVHLSRKSKRIARESHCQASSAPRNGVTG